MNKILRNTHFIFLLSALIFLAVLLNRSGSGKNEKIIKIIPAEIPRDAPFVHVSEDFIKNKLWPKLLELTGGKSDFPYPKFTLLVKDPYPVEIEGQLSYFCGRYFPKTRKIQIYRFHIYEELKKAYKSLGTDFSPRENNILTIMTIAHEFLHYIYDLQGVPLEEHHKKMRRDKSSAKICEFLSKELGSDKVSQILEKSSLDTSIERQNKLEQLEQLLKKSSL